MPRRTSKKKASPGSGPSPSAPLPPLAARLLIWPERFDGWIVFGAALLLRLVYLLEIRANDPFYAYAIDGFDQATYQKQAAQILDGDFLLSNWNRFYYSPLYAYFAALVYWIGGRSNFDLLHGVQAVLGAGSCWLLWALARVFLSRGAAILAAGFALFCRPWFFYEQLILLEGLVLFAHLAALWLLAAKIDVSRLGLLRVFAAGAAAGFAYLGRGNFLAVLIFLPLWIAWRYGRASDPAAWNPRRIASIVGVFIAGVAFALAPMAARNWKVAGVPAVGTTNGPALIYLGNSIDSTGLFEYSPRFQIAHEASVKDPGVYMRMMREDFAADPARIVGHLFRKTYYFWNAWDSPDNTNIYLARAFSALMRWTPVTEHVLFTLGLLGMALSWRRAREESLLWVYTILFSASIIVIYPVGRYRMQIFIPLIIFAARAVEWAWIALRAGRWVRIAAAGAGGAALAWVLAPFPAEPIRRIDYRTFLNASMRHGKIAAADRLAAWALRDYPNAPEVRMLRLEYLVARERWSEAKQESLVLSRARELSPGAWIAMAKLEVREGRIEQARSIVASVIQAAPDYEPARRLAGELDAMK